MNAQWRSLPLQASLYLRAALGILINNLREQRCKTSIPPPSPLPPFLQDSPAAYHSRASATAL